MAQREKRSSLLREAHQQMQPVVKRIEARLEAIKEQTNQQVQLLEDNIWEDYRVINMRREIESSVLKQMEVSQETFLTNFKSDLETTRHTQHANHQELQKMRTWVAELRDQMLHRIQENIEFFKATSGIQSDVDLAKLA